jgi:molecular chaperone DnaK
MKELGDKMDPASKAKVETAIGRLKEAQKSNNIEEMKSAIEQVNKEWNEIAQKMYAQTGAQAGQGAGAEAGTQHEKGRRKGAPKDEGDGKGDVQDADFEVMDDDKNNK